MLHEMLTIQFYNLAKSSNNAKRKNNQEFAHLRSLGLKECWKVCLETMVDRVTNAQVADVIGNSTDYTLMLPI